MLITDESIDFIMTKVELLEGCYPQLQWDEEMTATAWLITLMDIKATEEEFEEVISYIIRKGYQSYEVNIALVVRLIQDDRHNKQMQENTKIYLKELESQPQADICVWKRKRQEVGI